jgi:hypothetical protein
MLLALLLVSLSWASNNDWRPRYLSGLPLLSPYKNTVLVDKYPVRYDYYYEDDILNQPYKKEKIESILNDSLRYSIHKMSSLGIPPVDCKDDLNVHLIQLSGQTLNNDDRFGSWRSVNGGNLVIIHGLYDPTIDVYRDSIIMYMLLPQNSDRVIFHEMVHYWYDRFCLYEKSSMKTETFVKSVENDYIIKLLQ